MREMTPEKALARLQDLCARAEHCEGEMREKLRQWGIGTAEANDIMQRLREDRYVDDRRFASAFVRDKLRFNRWGTRKIAMALAAKRVSRDIINESLAEIDPEEYENIRQQLIKAKLKTNPELTSTYEGRMKLRRFLMSRGF